MEKILPKEKANEFFKKHGIQDALVNLLQIKEFLVEEKDRNYWEEVELNLKILKEEDFKNDNLRNWVGN